MKRMLVTVVGALALGSLGGCYAEVSPYSYPAAYAPAPTYYTAPVYTTGYAAPVYRPSRVYMAPRPAPVYRPVVTAPRHRYW